jgi:hypothetical protein
MDKMFNDGWPGDLAKHKESTDGSSTKSYIQILFQPEPLWSVFGTPRNISL